MRVTTYTVKYASPHIVNIRHRLAAPLNTVVTGVVSPCISANWTSMTNIHAPRLSPLVPMLVMDVLRT